MENNEMAKEAAIKQIYESQEQILLHIANNKDIDDYIFPRLKFISEKIDEYGLDKSIFTGIIDVTYQRFVTYSRFAAAEKLAKKYSITQDKNVKSKNTIRLELAFPIAMTINFGIIFFCIIFFVFDIYWVFSVILAVIYMVSHPYIGKVFYLVALVPCGQIDKAFEPKDKNSWKKWLTYNALYFSALWPVFGLIFIFISTIGAVFGTIFKSLFFKK